MPAKITMEVRTSRGLGGAIAKKYNLEYNSVSSPGADLIKEDILSAIENRFTKMTDEEMVKVAARITRFASNKLRMVLPFVTDVMMGTRSLVGRQSPQLFSGSRVNAGYPNGPDDVVPGRGRQKNSWGESLSWRQLTRQTYFKKMGTNFIGRRSKNRISGAGNADKFFVHSGTLRQQIKAIGPNFVNLTGGIKATWHPAKKKPTKSQPVAGIGTLDIRIVPKLYPTDIRGLYTERWTDFNTKMSLERRLGLPSDAIKKLQGVPARKGSKYFINHRPMIQPALQFWLLNRLPAILDSTVERFVNPAMSAASIKRSLI